MTHACPTSHKVLFTLVIYLKIERVTIQSKRILGYGVGAPLCSLTVSVNRTSRSTGDGRLIDTQCQSVWFVQEIP